MITKWFFTKQFALFDLLQIQAAACTLNYPKLGCCNENLIISIFYLNPQFYQDTTWAQHAEAPYLPYQTIKTTLNYQYKIGNTSGTYTPNFFNDKSTAGYYKSINIDTGWFSPKILNTQAVLDGTTKLANIPVNAARYNPEIDDGRGNEIYVVSIVSGHYQKPTEDNLLFRGLPLWLMFFGLYSFLQKVKGTSFMEIHMFIIKSEYILPKHHDTSRPFFPFIDLNFINGKNPYNSYISTTQRQLWYPNCTHQVETLNNFVKCGPFVPKLDNDRDSTWELPFKSTFYFKWGVHRCQTKMYQIQKRKPPTLCPIQSNKDYKSKTHSNKQLNPFYMSGTTDEDSLKQKLLSECSKTLALNQMCANLQRHQGKDKGSRTHSTTKKKKTKKIKSMSPLTLRKFFLRKRGRRKNLPPPHPAAAAAAKAAQATAPHTHQGPERKTECFATSNRRDLVVLTRFKKGFEEETEKEVAAAFHRPPRTYKEDTPFYPWLPPAPKVNFKLNFKF